MASDGKNHPILEFDLFGRTQIFIGTRAITTLPVEVNGEHHVSRGGGQPFDNISSKDDITVANVTISLVRERRGKQRCDVARELPIRIDRNREGLIQPFNFVDLVATYVMKTGLE